MSLPFLRFKPSFGARTEARGWDISWTVANDIRRFPRSGGPIELEEDQETSRIAGTYHMPLSAKEELAVEAVFLSRGGGFLDPIIDGWHKYVLRWSDSVRDTTPFGRSIVNVPGSGPYGSAAGLGDTTVAYTRQLSDRYSVSAALKVPTGRASDLMGSGAFDAGVSIASVVPINARWKLYLQAGLVAQGKPTELKGARGLVDQESFAFVYIPNSKDTWIAQWQSEASALSTGVSGSDAAHRIISFGYRRRISSTQTLEGFFSEDRDLFMGRFPEGANVGPDFTAGLRLIVRL